MDNDPAGSIALPEPDLKGRETLERAVARRRSIREFAPRSMTMGELGQLLWAAQGVSDPSGLRTAPSAGALYPLELYAIVGASGDLEAGIYHYLPRRHGLELVAPGDFRAEFAAAALMQPWTAQASLVLIVAAAFARTTAKYGERGRRYVAIEAGHAVQNVYLQAVALGLGATEVGAFRDDAVASLVGLPSGEEPVTSVVVGRLARGPGG
jgi:SagB-type dehydrogenase family enzyme